MNQSMVTLIVLQIPILLFSIIVHECAHGWMAERCGDDTARIMGRITLNPFPHIDILGTLILPLIFIISSSRIVFGYAKPVPINPYRFNRPRRDTILVSFAGPASNFLLAIGFSLVMRISLMIPLFSISIKASAINFFVYAIYINIILAIINLVPIPPLDGSGIVSGLLPKTLAYQYDRIRPYGFYIFIFFLISGLLFKLINLPIQFIYHILLQGLPL